MAQDAKTGTALEVPQSRAMITPTKDIVKQALDAILHGELPPEVGDPEVTRRAILAELASAESFDQVFRPEQSLPSWRDLVGVEVTVYGFHLNPSTFEGQSVYAVVELDTDGSQEPRSYSCGGEKVMVQLVKAWEHSWFPFKATLVEKATSTPGRNVLEIVAKKPT